MKASSPYPFLDNRPIDQWKVTELKEELKRRKLPIKGLKEDLIKRLDEAIRNENESAGGNTDNGSDDIPQPVLETEDAGLETEDAGTVPAVHESTGDMMDHDNEINEVDGVMDQARVDDSMSCEGKVHEVDGVMDQAQVDDTLSLGEDKVQEGEVTGGIDFAKDEKMVVSATSLETNITVNESVVSVIAVNVLESRNSDSQNGRWDLESQLENEEIKPPHEDVELDTSDPNNQVSEVSTVLGFQVKSDSISTDCLSINENNELKDNIIADNVKLELDVKPEIAQPSSTNVLPDAGKSHPMDVEDPHDNEVHVDEGDDNKDVNAEMSKEKDVADVVSSEKLELDVKPEIVHVLPDGGKPQPMDGEDPNENELDDNKDVNAEMSKENESAYLVSSEKLNLDRSSGDDSIEDDALDSKQIISMYNLDEVVDRNEQTEAPVVEEKAPVDDMQVDIPANKKDIHDETDNAPAAATVKRKPHGQVVGSNETSKRQRRWNSENLEVPEPQTNIAPSTTPKEVLPSATAKCNFSSSNSTASEYAPKERVVPPSPRPPTNSLRIDRFLRPFTLKAVQEFLGKTGTVASFWMDHIKTHCYVTYSSVKEAIETRNAVYNLQWPSNGGRLLVAEFVDPQEVKMRAAAPLQSPATPVAPGPTIPPTPPALKPQSSPRPHVKRQQLPPLPSLPPPPPLSNPPQARERLPLPPPPPLPEKMDPPIVTLDDLFRKTKATPRIYYLPLSDEQVAEKIKAQGKSTKQ